MQLREAIKKRRSYRKFAKSKPDWRRIIRAIDAARYAPAAGNHFVLRFILVSDKKKIEKIGKATQQDFVSNASYLVVCVSDDSKLVKLYGERGKRYASQQAGAAIQNFLLWLTQEKLITTWVGHFADDQVKEELNVPNKMTVEAVFPIGKRLKVSKPKEKSVSDLENLLYFDSWGNKYMEPKTRVKLENF